MRSQQGHEKVLVKIERKQRQSVKSHLMKNIFAILLQIARYQKCVSYFQTQGNVRPPWLRVSNEESIQYTYT